MTSVNPRLGWEKLANEYYRKISLYTTPFDPDLELENYFITGSPYAGALALWPDKSKILRYRQGQSTKFTIDIYSCSGNLISRLNWDKAAIKAVGWSDDERLVVVAEDGVFHVYDGLYGEFAPYNLGHGADEEGVKECRFWGQGFIALLGNSALVAVNSFQEPRPRLLAGMPHGEVHAWSIIAPQHTLSRSVEVLLAVEKTIYVVDINEAEDRGLTDGPFLRVAVSPNGKFVALYTEGGRVWVVGSDFQNKYSEYDSKTKTAPNAVYWCGNDAVVLVWEDEVHLIGPNGAATKYYFDDVVHVVPDMDGVRLISAQATEYLQKVPDQTEEVFKLGSSASAAILFDSIDLLDQKSPKADENIQRIRSSLPEAVETCIRAAGQQFDHALQRQLLRAASFGKSVLDLYSSDEFVEMCETLRVLNAVRDHKVGLPLTLAQYAQLGPDGLITRLIHRREYVLAMKLADFLKLPVNRVYVDWARQKVKTSTGDDDSILEVVVERLRGKHGISFETIARAAYDEGRGKLATSLLNHEPRAGKQVPLLLNMEEDELALDKAIESGDPDLIFFVLFHVRTKMPQATFFRLVNARPLAAALVESSAQAQDKELLKDMFYQDDRPIDGSNLLIEEATRQTQAQAVVDKLRLAAKLLTDAKDPSAVLQTRALAEATQLLKMQEAFDRDITDSSEGGSSGGYLGLSVNETMFKLIKSGYSKRADKVRNDFKVGERTWWWIRLRALVAARLWGEVEEISKNRKSPIGWEPFFNEVLAAGNPRLASSFIPKCTNIKSDERVEMWVKCGMVSKAGEEALKAKNLTTLESLRDKTTGAQLADIERMINQLRPRK